ncbi:MAG: 2-hydroxyglutaryl-CoA dehydratase [Firmicutes bacterium]|nr:2-hydroxyglutaryl-CoA dehydratase [Bacillota bacterium]
MITVGIDVGSISTKAALLDDEKFYYLLKPTGWSPRQAGLDCFTELLARGGYERQQVDFVVATGYGRITQPFASKVVTEITCHARGANHLVSDASLVIDIGGQDSKVIRVDGQGRVLDFVMNDKCAAGTGRFLQVMGAALGVEVSELSELARGRSPVTLNSMCAVFAESEVIGLLAAGREKGEIVAGLFQSISRRIASMAQRLAVPQKVVFTGGVALNEGMRERLQRELGAEVVAPVDCQYAGAIGAAILARDFLSRKN